MSDIRRIFVHPIDIEKICDLEPGERVVGGRWDFVKSAFDVVVKQSEAEDIFNKK